MIKAILLSRQEKRIADLPLILPTEIESLTGDFRLLFTYPRNQEEAGHITRGNKVAIKDMAGNWQLYEITNVNIIIRDQEEFIHAECEHVYYDLGKYESLELNFTNVQAEFAVTQVLDGTDWQVGTVEITTTRTTTVKGLNPLASLQHVKNTWGGEIQFRITMSDTGVSGRYVDLLTRLGKYRGKRFEFGYDLKGVEIRVNKKPVRTALYGWGIGTGIDADGNTERIDFADVEWVKGEQVELYPGGPTAEAPVNKPLGQKWVGDDDARVAYGFLNPSTMEYRHIFGDYDSQARSPQALIWETWRQVEKQKDPIVFVEGAVAALEQVPGFAHEIYRLGDTCVLKIKGIEPLEARLIQIQRFRRDPRQTVVTLGNFRVKSSDRFVGMQQILTKAESRSDIWDRADSFNPDGTLPTSVLDGVIDTVNNQIIAGGGTVIIDDGDGFRVIDTDDPATALGMIRGVAHGGAAALVLGSRELVGDPWDIRVGMTSEGFQIFGEEIVAGKILTDLVRIEGDTSFYWDGVAMFALNPEDANNYWRFDKDGLRLTKDGGSNWIHNFGLDKVYIGTDAEFTGTIMAGAVVQSPSEDTFPVPVFRGEWQTSTYYFKGDVVTHNGSSWIYVHETSTVQEPQEPSDYWVLYSSKGSDGQDGEPGQDGTDGTDGSDGDSIYVEFSVDGETLWHYPYQEGDLYMRTKIGAEGTWTDAIRIVGEDGQDGAAGQDGQDGDAGDFKEFRFAKNTSTTTPPALTNTDREPAGWSEAPPALNEGEFLWKTTAWIDGDTNALIGTWTSPVRISGEKGDTGADGQDGSDAPFLKVQYSVDGNAPWHDTYAEGRDWMRTSNDDGATWSDPIKIVGEDGQDGSDGSDGTDGTDGRFVHYVFKRSETQPDTPTGDGTPTGWSDSPPADDGNKLWVSTALKEFDGTLVSGESWSTPIQLEGDDGEQGPQGPEGPPGDDGQSLYTWIAYADDDQGGGFSFDPTDKEYIGIAYNKESSTMSQDPEDYTWSLYRGEDGIDGAPGDDGASLYTWIAYADDAVGTGFSFLPEGKDYIGLAYNKETATASETPGDYAWSKIKGEQGEKGDQGEQGPEGPTGPEGPQGDQGIAGPGVVFRGEFEEGATYFYTDTRRDVVLYNDSYYLFNVYDAGGIEVPSWVAGQWENFGAVFHSVATGLLLAEDATILRALTIGSTEATGLIRSVGKADYGVGSGFWLGVAEEGQEFIPKVDIGNSDNFLRWNGSALEIKGNVHIGSGSTFETGYDPIEKASAYYSSHVPTLDNYPASSWDPDTYEMRLGSLFFDISPGNVYRFAEIEGAVGLSELESGDYVEFEETVYQLPEPSLPENLVVLSGAGEELDPYVLSYPYEWILALEEMVSRLTNVEFQVTDEAVVSKVTNSDTFLSLLGDKADADNLGDYALLSQLEDLEFDLSELESAFGEVDFGAFITGTEMIETAKDFNFSISRGGGVNLLRNSVGFAGLEFWEAENEDAITTVTNEELRALGYGSGFMFIAENISSKVIKQDIHVVSGEDHVVSCRLQKESLGGNSDITIRILEDEAELESFTIPGNEAFNYERVDLKFVTTQAQVTVEIEGGADAEAIITATMVNIGENVFQWTMHPQEIYNSNVQMDLSGIKVSQIIDGVERGFTRITPDEFAGYYDTNNDGNFEKIFWLQEDETRSKKFHAEIEILMGALKVMYLENENSRGWAFIPTIKVEVE